MSLRDFIEHVIEIKVASLVETAASQLIVLYI